MSLALIPRFVGILANTSTPMYQREHGSNKILRDAAYQMPLFSKTREELTNPLSATTGTKDLLQRATGRFYTHNVIGQHLVLSLMKAFDFQKLSRIRLVEPFCGDGRLVCWLMEAVSARYPEIKRDWEITLWEIDEHALPMAVEAVQATAARLGERVTVCGAVGNSFHLAKHAKGAFHICLTNPPWETLKPDRRELELLSSEDAANYTKYLRVQTEELSHLYPHSVPSSRFSGWGVNLARCGTEAALQLVSAGGVCGVVLPASLLADTVSEPFRKWLFSNHTPHDISYYVAEARLFAEVDQQSVTLTLSPNYSQNTIVSLTTYDKACKPSTSEIGAIAWNDIRLNGYTIPIQFGSDLLHIVPLLRQLPTFADLEGERSTDLWAGRELDETKYQEFVAPYGVHQFLKGRMIQRFEVSYTPSLYLKPNGPAIPKSASFHRLVWRDVARPSQKRRIYAAIIPPSYVTGNSLSVAYFRNNSIVRLQALLGLMSSFVFEAQVRMHLATAHISLGAVRKAHLPPISDNLTTERLAYLVGLCQKGDVHAQIMLEVVIAQLYALSHEIFSEIVSSYPKLENQERENLLDTDLWSRATTFLR